MSINKSKVRSDCLSCGRRISGPAVVVVVTRIREDNHQARAYLVHEACQSAMLRGLPFDDHTEPEALEERSGD